MVRPLRAVAAAGCAALLLPAAASAHAGPTLAVATDFVARIGSLPAGVEAKVIDGDRGIWLRVAPPHRLTVLGFAGEPYLRFGPGGVEANEASPTWVLNRARPGTVAPHATAGEPPSWKRVADGPAYRWNEDRLHALALVSRASGTRFVGRWALPVRIDGRAGSIRGALWHVRKPSLLWFWPAVVLLACLPALLRVRSAQLTSAAATALTVLTTTSVAVAAVARLLYGRPDVAVTQWLWLAALGAGVAAVSWRLHVQRSHAVTAIVVGAVGIALGLAWIDALLKGHAISALPADVLRAAVVGCLGGGAALLVCGLAAPEREPA